MDWYPIDDAELRVGFDHPVLLAAFDGKGDLIWACAAELTVWHPGTTQCASARGWSPKLPMVQENLSRERWATLHGRIGGDFPPTHWAPLNAPQS